MNILEELIHRHVVFKCHTVLGQYTSQSHSNVTIAHKMSFKSKHMMKCVSVPRLCSLTHIHTHKYTYVTMVYQMRLSQHSFQHILCMI